MMSWDSTSSEGGIGDTRGRRNGNICESKSGRSGETSNEGYPSPSRVAWPANAF
jgi:hypothetical protein